MILQKLNNSSGRVKQYYVYIPAEVIRALHWRRGVILSWACDVQGRQLLFFEAEGEVPQFPEGTLYGDGLEKAIRRGDFDPK